MERVPNGKYTKEFREESVKLVTEGGLSVVEASRRLSLPPSTLNTWVKHNKSGKLREIGKTQKPLTEIDTHGFTAVVLTTPIQAALVPRLPCPAFQHSCG